MWVWVSTYGFWCSKLPGMHGCSRTNQRLQRAGPTEWCAASQGMLGRGRLNMRVLGCLGLLQAMVSFAAPRLKLSGEPVHKTNQLFEAKPGQISMGPQAAAEKWLRKMGLRATWGGCGPQLRNCYLFFFLLLLFFFFFFRLLRFKVIPRSLQEPPAPPEQEEEVEDLEASHSLS